MNTAVPSFEQEGTYDFTINAILDLTIGRYNIASIDPRNIEPFMQQCKLDISEMLDSFAQKQLAAASRQPSRPASALENQQQQTTGMREFYLQKQQQEMKKENNNNIDQQQQPLRTEKEESLYKSLLSSQTNESAWKDMCSELVDELEAAQGKRNELAGQLSRRESLLKEMRIAYFTEITHLREMVRQFKTKGSCALPEISTFNWKDDNILSEQLIREQKQKHEKNLEQERLRHQRELDLAYERYSKVNEHLRSQITQLEREKRGLDKSLVVAKAQLSGMEQSIGSRKELLAEEENNNKTKSQQKANLGNVIGVDLTATKDSDKHGDDSSSSISSKEGSDDDDDEHHSASQNPPPGGSRREQSSSSAVKFTDENNDYHQQQQSQNPHSLLRPDSASPSNVPLSRMASNFDKQSNLSAPLDIPSYPATPVPQPPTPHHHHHHQSSTFALGNTPVQKTHSSSMLMDGTPLKTSPTTANPPRRTTTTTTTTSKTSARSNKNNNNNTTTTTSARPSSARKQQQSTTTKRPSSSSKKSSATATTSGFVSAKSQADFLSRMSAPDQHQQGNQFSGVSEKTLTQLMDNHKRAMDTMKAERDAAISRANATKEQLATSLKKIDKLVADAQDREEEITDLRKRLENPSGADGGANNKNSIEIKATNLRLREELLRKNQILEGRTKELLQLQEETARWFEAFRAVHPADRSPINYAVLERLSTAVLKAEKAEAQYRQSTWTLLSAQLRHRTILDKMKEEARQLQQLNKAAANSSNTGEASSSSAASTSSLHHQARTLQKQTELVYSQLWRHTARLRQHRSRFKNEANIAWDLVLFTARALVNHEDIAVVHEFTSLVNEPTLKKKDEAKFLEDQRKEAEEEQKRKKEEEEARKRKDHDDLIKSTRNPNRFVNNQAKKNHDRASAIIKGTLYMNDDDNIVEEDETTSKTVKTSSRKRSTSPPTTIQGRQGTADVDEMELLNHNNNNNTNMNRPSSAMAMATSSRSLALMKKPTRPGSAAAVAKQYSSSLSRPQTPISAVNDLRCLPMSQIPSSTNFIPSSSLGQMVMAKDSSSSTGKFVRNLHSSLHRKQRYDDLENRQRTVDEIKMRTLRYYTTRSAVAAASSNNNQNHHQTSSSSSPSTMMLMKDTDESDSRFMMMDGCMHRAKLFGRNEETD